ncbi:MAG: hypothetical protein CL928_07730 [Deltaproteobacteria bacterium]|nr:hypothetical protein [Deltaproteobacteria bacterium]
MKWLCLVFLASLSLGAVCPVTALAQTSEEDEARRQLEVARQEVGNGNFEQALSAADTALRLYPSLYEAMMFKALAYEGLGNLKRAESLLSTFKELAFRSDDKKAADEALVRVLDKLGKEEKAVDSQAASEPAAGSDGAAADQGEGDAAAGEDPSESTESADEESGSSAAERDTGKTAKKPAKKKPGKKKAAKKKPAKKKPAKKGGKKAAPEADSAATSDSAAPEPEAGEEPASATTTSEPSSSQPEQDSSDKVASADDGEGEAQASDQEPSDGAGQGESAAESDEGGEESSDEDSKEGAGATSESAPGANDGPTGSSAVMPSLPEGSEEFLTWMLHTHRRDLLLARRDMGLGVAIGGLVLTAVGAGLAGGMAALSLQTPGNANIEAIYSAGLGSLFGGLTLVGVGVPMLLVNQVGLQTLGPVPAVAAVGSTGRSGGLALRF